MFFQYKTNFVSLQLASAGYHSCLSILTAIFNVSVLALKMFLEVMCPLQHIDDVWHIKIGYITGKKDEAI